VHVQDVCTAALFLAEHKDSDGQAYNLNDDTQITVVEFMQHMGELLNKPITLLPPVPVNILKGALLGAATVEELVSKHLTHRPPKLEKDTIRYLGKDIAYSNQKLKDLGYRFLYPDARIGLQATVDWYRTNGWM
jgi:nucleoside-diphosphate-sugar epimerase